MIELFTLTSCPICEVIKKKMKAKNIDFVERKDEGTYVSLVFNTDRFPVLKTEERIFTSLSEIKKWLEEN